MINAPQVIILAERFFALFADKTSSSGNCAFATTKNQNSCPLARQGIYHKLFKYFTFFETFYTFEKYYK